MVLEEQMKSSKVYVTPHVTPPPSHPPHVKTTRLITLISCENQCETNLKLTN